MSRRLVLIGIVVAALAALVASGTASAVASPHAVAARKHHKKKKRRRRTTPTHPTTGGPASGCSGTTTPYTPGDPRWNLAFNCASGSFSQFQVATNHPIYRVGLARAVSGSRLIDFTCQLTSSTSFSCTGGPVTNETVHVYWQVPPPSVGNPQCTADPGETVSVTVSGKSFAAPVSGC